jgi:hypothetical protein
LEFKETRITLDVEEQEPRLLKLIIFAVVMMLVAYLPFSATMRILKSLYDGTENPKHYSLLTVCVTSMWDTVLCLIAFVYAFEDQVFESQFRKALFCSLCLHFFWGFFSPIYSLD